MRRPAQHFRLLLALLATLQVAAPPAASLADAAFARGAEWLGLHVEDRGAGRRDHPPHRDDCFFCQFLAQPAVAPHAGAEERLAARLVRLAVPAPDAPRHAVAPHLPDSRAPPFA